MAPMPPLKHATILAIYKAYEDANQNWDSLGMSVGELGTECDRALWYSFRWATAPEEVNGQKVRIFRRGDIEEGRLISDLESIGVEVFGQQDRIRLVSGHVRGKIDGRCLGLPEAPKTEHLCEFKSSNAANFKVLVREGVRKAQPKHFVQCQLGMHAMGLTRALYLVANKDDEALYEERLEYDIEFCARLLARAERLVQTENPPAPITDKEDDFRCMFCKHKPICHARKLPRVTCRSCIHSTPEMSGSGHWSCARWDKPISFDEQKQACPTHLFIPAFVPGEQIDFDADAETVTYRMKDGSTWVDGALASEE